MSTISAVLDPRVSGTVWGLALSPAARSTHLRFAPDFPGVAAIDDSFDPKIALTDRPENSQDAAPVDSTSRAASLLDELIRDHSSAMFRLAKSIVREDALAEDIVQESIIKAWQASATFRGDSSVKTWALRITHNTAISVVRRRREEYRDPARLPDEPNPHGTERDVHGRMMVAELWEALNLLDPVSRTITVLREIEGMSYEEISETLELPLPTVKTRLFRARKLLAGQLSEWR